MRKRKVLFHINDYNKWAMVITNIRNFFAGLNESEEAEVVVLINGEAASACTSTLSLGESLEDIEKKFASVDMYVCSNSLAHLKIDKSDVPQYLKIVPAGVVFIDDMQSKGYSYIKP